MNQKHIRPLRLSDLKILIRGAGEMASGCACRLHRSGLFRIIMTEVEKPLAVRRTVSFCEALYEGGWTVEDIRAERIDKVDSAEVLWDSRVIPVMVDPEASCRNMLKPHVLIDAILAKKNLGTTIEDAPLVIALGPGFCAGKDAHYVVETDRGHDLGRLISDGFASPDTGVPGPVSGHSRSRVLRAPANGVFLSEMSIGTPVEVGQVVGYVSGEPVTAGLDGVLRGLIRPGTSVCADWKIGDIDPRGEASYCARISEKSGAIGGAVLEAVLRTYNV
ncbi:MAG: selenium-dependent molybdenum cofactor biosynthesis protein YqeB [Pseudomonadota bacterium]